MAPARLLRLPLGFSMYPDPEWLIFQDLALTKESIHKLHKMMKSCVPDLLLLGFPYPLLFVQFRIPLLFPCLVKDSFFSYVFALSQTRDLVFF
jgi:hypothetical protein